MVLCNSGIWSVIKERVIEKVELRKIVKKKMVVNLKVDEW
jgi:hypothetical protein